MSAKTQRILYWLVVLCSVLFIWGGYRLTADQANLFRNENGLETLTCRVDKILHDRSSIGSLGGNYYTEQVIIFEGTVLDGEKRGETVQARQTIDNISTVGVQPVSVGDKIFLHGLDEAQNREEFGADYEAGEFLRSDKLLILGAVFLLGLLAFGRKKGFNTILSLVFTCLSIFLVFVPAILAGYNAYLVSILICAFVIAMTLTLVSGFNIKSLAAALGCAGGVTVAGGLTLLMDRLLKLTGYLSDDSMYVSLLNEEHPISLKGIIFAAIIIGALGATMDVSMDIASALSELRERLPDITFHQLMQSGLNIGRDIMGTMSNTLILAYIGSSLSTVLLFASYQNSLLLLLNREAIVVELLQALSGSIGILCTIPISALISSALYHRRRCLPAEAGASVSPVPPSPQPTVQAEQDLLSETKEGFEQ